MNIRPYKSDTDLEAILRIWHEVGWSEAGNDDHAAGVEIFAAECRGWVAELDDSPECYASTAPGTILHGATALPLSAVTAVATSHIARRQGLAQRLTAKAIATDAAEGAMVSALGIFDQGFYDKLGFGTGSYERWHSLDPADLRVPIKARRPRRLTKNDWEAVHDSRTSRRRGHGSCNLHAYAASRAEMLWSTNGFGFGYADGANGELTHHIWFSSKGMENGPLNALWMAYQTPGQFLELMAMVSNLGDQIHLVRLREPAGIQLQDLLNQPFRRNRISEKSQYEARTSSYAYSQMRICDLEGCVAAATLDGLPVRFNLELTDPIEALLDDDAAWRGVGGSYIIELGPESTAKQGSDPALPTLQAGVGAFTRMWMGVLPASGLAVTDDLVGPADLLADLDRILCLPVPKPDWDF